MQTDQNILGIAGQKALVVGGGYGMGRESALLLARAGVSVAVADLDMERAAAVRDEVTAFGVAGHALTADVTDRSQAEALVREAPAALGGLDILINIVGLATFASVFDLDDDLWDRQFSLNLRQHLYVSREAARVMMDAGKPGAMALVASVSGIYGAPLHAAYGAAKAGLMGLVRTMSQEWGHYGIRVNAVAPDGIATPRVKASFAAQGSTMQHLADDTSLKRNGEARDIAGALVYLVSDLAAFVTGQTIIVDGGVHAQMPHKMDPWERKD